MHLPCSIAASSINLMPWNQIANSFDTSAVRLLFLEGIIRSVGNASALTWCIRYIYYWNLQFRNNVPVFIIKTKIIFPRTSEILTEAG